MDGAGVGGTCLAAVLEENERAPALAFRGGAWMVRSRRRLPGGSAVRRSERAPALAFRAVRGRCRSRRHLPGGSAGREGEDTSTSLGGSAWMVQE